MAKGYWIVHITIRDAAGYPAYLAAEFLGTRPAWLQAQRVIMGFLLAGFALKMATESRR